MSNKCKQKQILLSFLNFLNFDLLNKVKIKFALLYCKANFVIGVSMSRFNYGLDLGSTGTKYVVMQDNNILYKHRLPTGWSSKEVSATVKDDLIKNGFSFDDFRCVSTGYGRINVDYANKNITEITCHAKGSIYLFGCENMTVIDIGGQDTKIIVLENGQVQDFVMNDKCSAGTGRFLEVMANAMGYDPVSLCELAKKGSGVKISSMCTVFAESEVIGLAGAGTPKQDIAFGIVESITEKVVSQCRNIPDDSEVFLTGGLCVCPYILESLSSKLKREVKTHKDAMYAGAIGAAIFAEGLKK